MQLTRRDAAAALGAIGATGGLALGARHVARSGPSPAGDDWLDDDGVRAGMVAVATVVYPSAISGIAPFVNRFLDGRLTDGDHADGIRSTVTELDRLATEWHDAPLTALSEPTRDRLLREVGADTADEAPEGTTAERVRYYVVNELLLALYASPTGGELIGIENPPGHPGGAESYTRGSP